MIHHLISNDIPMPWGRFRIRSISPIFSYHTGIVGMVNPLWKVGFAGRRVDVVSLPILSTQRMIPLIRRSHIQHGSITWIQLSAHGNHLNKGVFEGFVYLSGNES